MVLPAMNVTVHVGSEEHLRHGNLSETTLCTMNQTVNEDSTKKIPCERRAVGTHVRLDVDLGGLTFFGLCEFQVYGRLIDSKNGLTNVALYKYARQSSSDVASQAVDGEDGNTFFPFSCTHVTRESSSGSSSNAWWMVDLGNLYDIEAVHIHTSHQEKPSENFCVNMYFNDPIETSVRYTTGPGFYEPVGSSTIDNGTLCTCFTGRMDRQSVYRLNCSSVLRGRYVKIDKPGDTFDLCEVEVMARSLLPETWFGVPRGELSVSSHTDSKYGGIGWDGAIYAEYAQVRM
ncbi:uncharacterized protein [Littorina saxatilis]|uniref:uncharacterized protein n=1 Tax=Littorina saxatilis TaxID=31220 RepID=UPI0038B5015B